MTPEACGGETSTSAYGNLLTAFAAQGVRSTITTICDTGYAELPPDPAWRPFVGLYEANEAGYSSDEASSS